MEFSSLVQTIQNSLGFLGISPATSWLGVYPALVVAGVLVYACFRTQSSHLLVSRMWQFLSGKAPVNDPVLIAYFEDQDALMKFRFHTTLPVQTMAGAHRLIAWARQHEVSMREIRKCGCFFDLTRLRIQDQRLWNLPARAASFVAGFVCLYAFVVSAIFAVTPNVLVHLKTGEHRWLLVNSKLVVKTLTVANQFSREECAADARDIALKSGWQADDVRTVCRALNDPATPSDVADMLTEQRFAALPAACMFLVFTFAAFRLFLASIAADRLRRRLAARQDRQMAWDF